MQEGMNAFQQIGLRIVGVLDASHFRSKVLKGFGQLRLHLDGIGIPPPTLVLTRLVLDEVTEIGKGWP